MASGAPKPATLPPWGSAVAGATGAVVANAIVYPLDIVKTRLQVQLKKKQTEGEPLTVDDSHYHGTLDAIRKIIEHEGISGLYSGLNISLLGVASTNFAYFYWYSVVRTLYTTYQKPTKAPSIAVELSLGAVAGALAQLFTLPISVITTRQQTQPKHDKKNMIDTAREVINGHDGYAGLWRGLKASMVLVVNPAITYGAYQRLRDLLFPGKVSLKPHEAFLLGALSKSMATLVTQPLIVAKVGLQSRPPPAREGKPFNSFPEVMAYIIEHEGPFGLYKGVAPQLLKAVLVQGLLMMTKERMELLFIMLFAYIRVIRQKQLQKAADALRSNVRPMAEAAAEKAKSVLPASMK